MRKVVMALALVIGLHLVGRAFAEPFVIDMGDPTTYQADWGGPTLPGVLFVHCAPGAVSAYLITRIALRKFRPMAAVG
ncbi:hypothetical protein EDD29_3085 [Actinocorallia herbida]|uniref:Uncharacterized protein n=1 Tax=Actinocorallia herbida TaxID=58109 RepID=A0A3N1CW62_9ACTN|nr:hypothetical protein [Actinocorallia herbida]ROO85539.1 hypothetical protein EDD29_3085 [Actinocorallia herbida]